MANTTQFTASSPQCRSNHLKAHPHQVEGEEWMDNTTQFTASSPQCRSNHLKPSLIKWRQKEWMEGITRFTAPSPKCRSNHLKAHPHQVEGRGVDGGCKTVYSISTTAPRLCRAFDFMLKWFGSFHIYLTQF